MVAEHGGAMADGGEALEGTTWAQQSAQARAQRAGERGGAAGARTLAEVEEARWISPTGAVARREAERVRAVLVERRSSAGVSERAHRLRQE